MIPTIKLDGSEFSKAVREYVAATKKDSAQVLNDKAFFIARRATWTTNKADPEQIEASLGVVGNTFRVIRRGKNAGAFRKTGYIMARSSRAENIVRARLHAKGDKQPTRAEIEPLVRKFVNRRRSASGFVRSGWTAAASYLAKFAKRSGAKPVAPGAKPKVSRSVGSGSKAIPSIRPVAKLWNEAASAYGNNQKHAATLAEVGLRKSIAEEIADMKAYAAKKLQETANKFRGR